MAYLDSADLAKRVKTRLNRPSTDEMFTRDAADDVVYEALTDSQDEEIKYFAARVPSLFYGDPVQLTTTDAGKTWVFPNDADSAAIIGIGHFKLYATLSSIPDWPLTEGEDYIVEDSNIRIPGNTTRTFENGLGPWSRHAAPGNVITSATQPSIPKPCRQAVISGAAASLAWERLKQDPSAYITRRDNERTEALVALRTRSQGSGGGTRTSRLRRGYGRRW